MAEIERGRRVVLKGGPCDGRVLEVPYFGRHWTTMIVPVISLKDIIEHTTEANAGEPIQTARYRTDGTYIP